MFTALLVSFGVVFVAELGDKSQLMAMTYALRYRWWIVLIGITVATTAVHAVSVVVGHFLGLSIPVDLISIVGGLAMLVFALWTLRGDELDADEQSRAARTGASVLLAVMSSFFLAELGDKTMLATITLATDHDWLGVWIGSTVGMVVADALAIAVGMALGRKLPERTIALAAAALFSVFAGWLLVEGITAAHSTPVTVAAIAAAVAIVAIGTRAVVTTHRRRRSVSASAAGDQETGAGSTRSDDRVSPA
ncbi:TMEM165/GDT1 family protein [Williamsia deligens]|uniref:GDT1 family protein n=1 Tax=Williamsia deligens TaxID=321325 RepID=A0ABW3G5M3_9NOCA|nr:TMEM165/GDT1 family protein [Williamsia deligens]MCP2193907.1 putative Ca2+/H+ antiporter, TMEM165/GDT1 family [Williamsia deligens]